MQCVSMWRERDLWSRARARLNVLSDMLNGCGDMLSRWNAYRLSRRSTYMLNRWTDHMMQVRNYWYDWVLLMMLNREPRSDRHMLLGAWGDCVLPGRCLMLCKWIRTGKLTLPLRLDTWWGN